MHSPWLAPSARHRVAELAGHLADLDVDGLDTRLHQLVADDRAIHHEECLNLDPASNVMNPRAEALLATGLGTRPSLGHPGDKYETGLEAIEQIEVLAELLARRVFRARHAELRVASGAMANLYAFMATCRPGDRIVVPPASIGGHVTHHAAGAAGVYGLQVVDAPVDRDRLTVDLGGLARLVTEVRPVLVTVGGSLNLVPHPVAAVREIADRVGARVLVDAAHMCGLIAGGVWPNPLAEGAHVMTMSTYKSLAGPPSGLVLTDDDELAGRIDAIAHPGLTANFDVGKTAALALTLLDWLEVGADYASAMVETARVLADGLQQAGLPVFTTVLGPTASHQVAIEAAAWGGGQAAAARLRRAGLLTCGIGLPIAPTPGDVNGLRLGTPEMVRWGMGPAEADLVADLIARALRSDPASVAADTGALRRQFGRVHFVRGGPLPPR